MLSTHLTRRQLFWLINCNKANFSSVICNSNGHIPIVTNKRMINYNEATILQDKQQYRSFWHSRPIQNQTENNLEQDLPIAEAEEEQKVASEEKEEDNTKVGEAEDEVPFIFAMKNLQYGTEEKKRFVTISYLGRNGRKYLKIVKTDSKAKTSTFRKIFVPEDVFEFVRAMDEVLGALEANRDNIHIHDKLAPGQHQDVLLHTAKASCTYTREDGTKIDRHFELDLYRDRNPYVQMRGIVPSEQSPSHKPKPKSMKLSLRHFHWLRQAIGEVFVENGETEVQQQLGEAPSLPDWLRKVSQKQKERMKHTVHYLATKSMAYGAQTQKWLKVDYKQNDLGQKSIGIKRDKTRFPNICVPRDVFAVVRAMDEVLNAVNENKEKIEAEANARQQNQPTTAPEEEEAVIFYTTKATGTQFDTQLDLCLGRHLFVQMRTLPNGQKPGMKQLELQVPLRHFHWVRRAIGEVFVESGEPGVQQQFGEPPGLPSG